ncbi:hypothetical protein [Pseudoalteromonas sp. 2-MNA-CIBAN-0060]|uniref:hypothetical protein n=1 Tax=Pseudoalteromonas sp. 2-MNA-CIBAN-0060 TaxID=3140431 RepID=UPI003331F1AD
MEKLILSLVTLAVCFSATRLEAKEQAFQPNDSVFLQSSCREVIEVFDRKQEPGKYAALLSDNYGGRSSDNYLGRLI